MFYFILAGIFVVVGCGPTLYLYWQAKRSGGE